MASNSVLFAFTLHQRGAVTDRHQYIILIIGAVNEGDNALGGAGFTGASARDFCGYVDGVAVKNRVREFGVAHAEIANRCSERGVTYGYPDHQAERKNRIDQWLAELCIFGEFMVDVQGLRV